MKYSYESDYIATEKWQVKNEIRFLPIAAIDPLPLVAAVLARSAALIATATFGVTAFTTSVILEELIIKASDVEIIKIKKDKLTAFFSASKLKLEKWRYNFDLISRFVEKINKMFGPILLIETIIGFAVPIFEFNKILQTRNTPYPRYYFEFIHTVLRFFCLHFGPFISFKSTGKNYYML